MEFRRVLLRSADEGEVAGADGGGAERQGRGGHRPHQQGRALRATRGRGVGAGRAAGAAAAAGARGDEAHRQPGLREHGARLDPAPGPDPRRLHAEHPRGPGLRRDGSQAGRRGGRRRARRPLRRLQPGAPRAPARPDPRHPRPAPESRRSGMTPETVSEPAGARPTPAARAREFFSAEGLLVAGLLFLLCAGILYPLLQVLSVALVEDGWPTARPMLAFFGRSLFVEALMNTLLSGVLAVIFGSVIGVPLALLTVRYSFPGRAVLGTLAVLPLVIPPFVGAVAFQQILGRSGTVNLLLLEQLGFTVPFMDGLT